MTEQKANGREPLECGKTNSAGQVCDFFAWTRATLHLHQTNHQLCACTHQRAAHAWRRDNCALCDCREFSKGVRIRDRINSVAGPMDDAHGRPFVLGKAERVTLPHDEYAKWRMAVETAMSGWSAAEQTNTRFWIACVLMPDGTWKDDYAFLDQEVFEPYAEMVPYDPAKPFAVNFDGMFEP